MFQNIGFTELLLIAIVALVLFGPQKLPEIGRMLGKTVRDFKNGAHALLNDETPAPSASNPAPSAQAAAPSSAVETKSAEPVVSSKPAVEFISSTPAQDQRESEVAPAAMEEPLDTAVAQAPVQLQKQHAASDEGTQAAPTAAPAAAPARPSQTRRLPD
ncbi:hypothetical protein GCM10008018_16390 [Paenibacillus marchantiophytorum]|uniref:Sec-independent protein translocase protein TatA n=1 Tax=Paenibacillus marchantiophytorum TaxID=1619310 RepID=A0ABQ2BS59_9BACL|nr:twin-arginine translocase TatA/TatE family subunit [Paenibacillus marchantiophytorum]GGI46292.1 hypothetical protein GCM10008018_16390 [Paenibacillus marchantiophytorum]